MKPIKAPQLLSKGIAVYVPTIANYRTTKLEIFYSEKNPLFNYTLCEENPQKIWEKKDVSFDQGSLFLYITKEDLASGFYKVMISQYNQNQTNVLSGSQVFGLLKSKPTLYIGLPYSTFSPILVA